MRATVAVGLISLAAGAALPQTASAAAAYPPPPAVSEARALLETRGARIGFALVDSRGRLHGWHANRVFVSASLVKAMLLAAYLRRIPHRLPSQEERRLLGPMILWSRNRAATALLRRLGPAPLYALAGRAGMRRFSLGSRWTSARLSAADAARLLRRILRLVPPLPRPYARRLLSGIVPRQRWGFAPFARRAGFTTYFKGGWRRLDRGRLVHEAALFERGRLRFSTALLSDGNRNHQYGTATLRLVARRLFGPQAARSAAPLPEAGSPATRRAGLVDVRRYAPGVRLDLRYASRRNLTGRRLPGYCRRWALLRRPAARDLSRVERALNRRGLGLKIWDAYRPARASRALVRWAYRTGRGHLVGTYIARRSKHNKGSAVDLTLVRLRDGRELRMGTRYDSLSPRAHTMNARGRILRRRLILVRAMRRRGFANYRREWWHFEHRAEGRRYMDVTLGCRRAGAR